MANFPTHIGVGTVVAGGLATLTLAADVIGPESLFAVTMAGVLGSILPDIDLKESRPARIMFSGLAVFFSFCILFANANRFSIVELFAIWLGSFVVIRYGFEAAFHRFSSHRGIWHSIIAGLLFWFLTAIVFKLLLHRHDGVAWLAGGFLFIGYITHLILDELYSVDVMDRRIKSSFGTALKLYDGKHIGESAVVAGAACLAFWLAPPSTTFVASMTAPQLWTGLHAKLLPRDNKWFGVIGGPGNIMNAAPKAAPSASLPVVAAPGVAAETGGPAPTSPITTGSLPAKSDSGTEGSSAPAPAPR